MIERSYVPEGMLRKTAENAILTENRKGLEEAMRRGTILESTAVMCDCRTMELRVDLGEITGILPGEEAVYSPDGTPVRDIAIITRVGKPIQFKIKDIRENGRGETIATLSRKEAQRECCKNYIDTLACGDIIPVRVTHLEPFGAFCDMGCGMVALLTVDTISVSRISHPSDRFRVGDCIMAVVKQIDRDTGRIYLSHKELLGTWEENAEYFSPGQTVTGIVRSVEDYGVFVELAPNLAGLAEPFENVSPGDACSVYIKSIIPERMKIKLVLIDICGTAAPRPFRYFVDTDTTNHMDRWVYSPPSSKKVIESIFDVTECPQEAVR